VAEAKPVGLAGQSVEPVRMITRRGQARQHPWDLPVEVAQVCTHNVRKLRASECCDSDKGDETHARRWCRYRIQCRHSDAMLSMPFSVLNSTNLLCHRRESPCSITCCSPRIAPYPRNTCCPAISCMFIPRTNQPAVSKPFRQKPNSRNAEILGAWPGVAR
jgi:hypothetical protein